MVTLLPGLEGSQSWLCSLSFNLSAGLHVPGMQSFSDSISSKPVTVLPSSGGLKVLT